MALRHPSVVFVIRHSSFLHPSRFLQQHHGLGLNRLFPPHRSHLLAGLRLHPHLIQRDLQQSVASFAGWRLAARPGLGRCAKTIVSMFTTR